MKRILFLSIIVSACVAGATHAAEQKQKPKVPAQPANVAAPRDSGWLKRHEGFVAIAKKGDVNLLFLGDSITDGWRGGGRAAWEKNFAPLKAANFGIGGDQTQHVLWRLQNGELDGIKPKLAVLMIGTNNLRAGNKDEEIVDGIKAIITELQKKSPSTKLLLLGIFPRGMKAEDPFRAHSKHINSIIAKWDDGGKTIKYLDIGDKFLEADGTLPKSIMPDALHLNAKGYEIEAEAILPTVKAMLQ